MDHREGEPPSSYEELYRLLVSSVKDYAIFMLDPLGRVLTWNAGAQRIKGYTAEEIRGQHFSRFYPVEDQQTGFPQLELEIATREGKFEHEGWRVRKDGSFFWANVIITATYDATGHLVGFSKVTRDLTDRKQIEEELVQANRSLRESQMRYRLLVEGVQDYAILMLSPSGIITTWNEGAERIKGYRSSEIIGKHFTVFYPPQALEKGFPAYELEKALAEGRFEDEGWRVRKDGSLFWANVILTAVYDDDHVHIGFAKITRDLTQRLRNEELMKKNQELLQINNELDSFIYTASHDLKAPILNIEGLLKVMEKHLSPQTRQNQKVEQAYELLYESVGHFKATIRDLTEVVRISKASQADIASIPLEEVVEEVKKDLSPQIEEAQAHLEVMLHCTHITFSRKNLKSLLYNLLSNALHYRSADRQARVRISCKPEEDFYVLTVEDNGLGIPRNKQEKIFALFQRLHTHVEGTGIGLYIVKKIIENAHGKVWVESEEGVGSTFRLYFKR
jgi:PAS domain S-box-containing protein